MLLARITVQSWMNLGPIRGNMSLSIQQQQAKINGNFTVGGGLAGSGPFSGYVTNRNYIQFIVQSRGVNPLFFYGSVQANGESWRKLL